MVRNTVLSPSSRKSNKVFWRWRQHVPLKHWYLYNSPHDITFQNTGIFITTAVTASDMTPHSHPGSVAVVILSNGHQGSRNYPRHIQNFITLVDYISIFSLRIISHNVLEVKVHTVPNLRSVYSIAQAMTTQCSSNIQLCILNPHLKEVFI